ncbi:MAG: hypothetical protein EPO51_11605 [Phenylobacterium sp.]|uniref:hypothetical protein n=1 Tax=Phenylobacterium sp. TaxID=1871053 RepID=UPI0012170B6A|nr:hypothetical protein [Phenylobacterium sp.]TAJ71764.1 MAG: hypothetical protein EPO51_11605 [Phenylobacterium sp.]
MARFGATAGVLVLFALMPGLNSAAATEVWHRYIMRGQVVEMQGEVVILCVGRAEGARPGQVLTVVRFIGAPGAVNGRPPIPRRDNVGAVRIDRVIDEHFAEATLVHGQARPFDLVELKAR